MAIEKIRAGLDSKTGYTSKGGLRKPPKLLHLVGKKITLAGIHENQRKAVFALKKLRQLGTKSAEKMTELEQLIRADWDERAWVADDINGVPVRRSVMDSKEVKRNIDRDLARAQKAVNEEQAEELAALMTTLGEAGQQNAAFRKGHKSPHAMLLYKTVGERRNGLVDGLDKEGVVGIEIAMARALADKDAERAAAATIAYDRLSAKQKELVTYSRDSVSEALVWNEWQAMQMGTEKTLYAVDLGHVLADTMQGKAVAAGKKTGISLRAHEAMNNLGLEFREDDLDAPAAAAPDFPPADTKPRTGRATTYRGGIEVPLHDDEPADGGETNAGE